MAIIRLLGKFINNLNRYWGPKNETGTKEVVKQWREDWAEGNRSTFCTHVPTILPVDEFFRPVSITLEQWKEHWVESRDGFKSEDLPHVPRHDGFSTWPSEQVPTWAPIPSSNPTLKESRVESLSRSTGCARRWETKQPSKIYY